MTSAGPALPSKADSFQSSLTEKSYKAVATSVKALNALSLLLAYQAELEDDMYFHTLCKRRALLTDCAAELHRPERALPLTRLKSRTNFPNLQIGPNLQNILRSPRTHDRHFIATNSLTDLLLGSIRMERENVTDPDAIIAVLKEQLDVSRNNEESLIKKLKQFRQRIADVAKVEKELSTEKTLREQKESELRRFRNVESVNKKLTLEVQTLQHKVTVLTGKNTSASKRLEQQKQQLKDKDTEQEKMRDYFQKLMDESKYYKEEVKKLALDKDHVDKLKRKSAELRKEIEEEKNLNKIHQDNIGCFKRQITNLESDKRDLELSQEEMGSQMDDMRKDMDALKSEIETHKNEAFKQKNLISKLQSDTLISKKVRRKLAKKVDETKQRVKDQDQIITDLKTEIRDNKDEQTETQIQITILKNERDLTLENLSKAQREVGLLKSTIEKQQQDILAMTLDQNKVGTELDQVKKDYDSARKQLIEVSKKLEQTQVLLGRHKDKVKQDVKLEEKRYMVIVAEKEGLERELQHSMHQVSQQRHTITVQKAAKEALEQTVKSLRQEVESLTLQNCEAGTKNSTLTKAFNKLKLQKAVFLPADKWRIYSSTHLQCKYRQFFRHERCVQRQAALVETQRKEIEELKLALSRRPDDVVQKLAKCQWDNRELKKQLMAFKGEKIVYEGSYQRVKEENRKLSEALSDVKTFAQAVARPAYCIPKLQPQSRPQELKGAWAKKLFIPSVTPGKP
ncbi:hypothetical protein ABVT39_003998 [Epinephelus coioides]